MTPSRRGFLAALAAAPLVPVVAAAADAPDEADARLDAVRRHRGPLVPDDVVPALKDEIEGVVALGAKLSSAGLKNDDEPDVVFVPYRKDR